jgi:hypothetical protein
MKREWTSVYCVGERHQLACLAWFRPFVPEAWGLPIAADIEEDVDTGRETAMRALFRLSDGRLKEALRRKTSRSIKVTIRDASPGILKGEVARQAVREAVAQPELERQ